MDKNFRIRLGISFLIVAALGAGVVVRAAILMLSDSDRLETAMNRQFRQDPPRMPRRGQIMDRNREPIAVSMEVKSLFANPGKVKMPIEVSEVLAPILKIPAPQIRDRLKSNKGFVWIKRQLSESEQEAVDALLDRKPAFTLFLGLSKENKRFYPHQGLAAHLMGFTGLDSNGLEGLELFYEKQMAGEGGKKPKDGRSLLLTIDNTLQYTLEQELAQGMKDTGALAITAMVMNADNGDIVAMGSSPSFNPNYFGQSVAETRRNRSVTDTYEPGSTMKPLLVAAALEEKIVTAQTKVFCEYGKMKIGKHWISESETKNKWGWLKVGEVLQKSSNVGATKIGMMLGSEKIFEWYKKFGITERAGLDLPGEVPGYIIRPEKWSKILQSNISFGHGITVTPLQVIRAYAALANGGYLVKPRLVKQFYSFEGEFLQELPLQSKKRVMEEKTAKMVLDMISAVATDQGTAPKAAIPGFVIAGKTGTSQKPIPGRGYRSGKYMSSFVGVAKGVKPNYVIYVMVDEPKFPYYGGETAAPIFRRIMTAALAREGISPDPVLIQQNKMAQKPEEKSPALAGADSIQQFSAAVKAPTILPQADEYWLMPDLTGLTAREVLDLFSGKDLKLQVRGAGLVQKQNPPPGALLKLGDPVIVRLERNIVVP